MAWGLRAAMMARCVDERRYPGVIQVLFKTQNNWARAADPIAELKKIGQLAGLGEEAFESCIQSEALANGILAERQKAGCVGRAEHTNLSNRRSALSRIAFDRGVLRNPRSARCEELVPVSRGVTYQCSSTS